MLHESTVREYGKHAKLIEYNAVKRRNVYKIQFEYKISLNLWYNIIMKNNYPENVIIRLERG